VFASSIDWPGWSRGGRQELDALEALFSYAPRYAPVARRARLAFSEPDDVSELKVTERLRGNAGTDFGVPSLGPASDQEPMGEAEIERQLALLKAAWQTFDDVAARAEGVELRKGPRGGGRDLGKIRRHVSESEEAYLTQLGSRPPKPVRNDDDGGAVGLRDAMVEALTASVGGRPLANPSAPKRPWSPRYVLRRTIWHALDHAWEIEDRARPASEEATT